MARTAVLRVIRVNARFTPFYIPESILLYLSPVRLYLIPLSLIFLSSLFFFLSLCFCLFIFLSHSILLSSCFFFLSFSVLFSSRLSPSVCSSSSIRLHLTPYYSFFLFLFYSVLWCPFLTLFFFLSSCHTLPLYSCLFLFLFPSLHPLPLSPVYLSLLLSLRSCPRAGRIYLNPCALRTLMP